jgi:hypothetical protein
MAASIMSKDITTTIIRKGKAFFLSCSTKDHMKVNFKRMDNLHLRLQTIEASSNNKLVDGQTALAMAAKL